MLYHKMDFLVSLLKVFVPLTINEYKMCIQRYLSNGTNQILYF